MPLVKPFPGLRPDPETAAAVIAPPYDVVSRDEAAAIAGDGPLNFLHVSRPEIDLPSAVAWDHPSVYVKGAENFQRLIATGVLDRDSSPCLYVYRLRAGDHVQTGLVATASIADYRANRVRRHEHTRPSKENDRVRHMLALDAQTGPVMCVYRDDQTAREHLNQTIRGRQPEYDGLELDGVHHSLWVVRESQAIAALVDSFSAIDAFYIADGHHRSAAAARVAAEKGGSPADPWQFFLVVLFAESEMRILDYNRVVADLNGMDTGTFMERVAERFSLLPSDEAVRPRARGEFGMYLDGDWYRLRSLAAAAAEPVAALDVSILSRQIIEPLLGITDPRVDARIDFVGGVRGLGELERRVDSGKMAVAFSLFPTPLEDLMAVADAGDVMPPKSTWFEPKLADGLISHLLTD